MPRLAPIQCAAAQQQALLPYANVTVKTDVRPQVQYYLAERQDQFPGVNVEQVWLRRYPLGDKAAQLFGTVGPINASEVHTARYRGVSQNAIVGQSGLEWYYDHYLRGDDGAARVQVDALGRFKGYLSQTRPVAGRQPPSCHSTSGSRRPASRRSLPRLPTTRRPPAGAFVALDPRTGEVLGMGSAPTFNPNIFTSRSQCRSISSSTSPSGYPLVNRAIQSADPTGSTFKGITATAALQSGAWNLTDTYDDTGVYTNGVGDTRHNAGHASYGTLDLTQAIMVSSDDFFYNLGRLLNADPATHPNGGALQQWARAYGIGRSTGIDLGGENSGILPSPNWRAGRDRLETACEKKHHVPSCGIAEAGRGRSATTRTSPSARVTSRPRRCSWLSPTRRSPTAATSSVHTWGSRSTLPDGTVLQRIDPPPARHINIAQQNLDAIRGGLHDAASQPGEPRPTCSPAGTQSQYPVYGKTGTAQHNNQADQSWYACYVPDPPSSRSWWS